MLRVFGTAIRGIAARATIGNVTKTIVPRQYTFLNQAQQQYFSVLSTPTCRIKQPTATSSQNNVALSNTLQENGLLSIPHILQPQSRTVIKWSRVKGKRRSVKTVTKRFYRLNWGIWIRPKAGRFKSMWRKRRSQRVRRLRHVFCNATQTKLLDKMVTAFWRRPRYYIDDPYNPYHKREEFLITRKAPLP